VGNELKKRGKCTICNLEKSKNELVIGSTLKNSLIETIKREHSEWTKEDYICINDLNHYREKHIDAILEQEKGALSSLEAEVAKSLKDEEILAKNINAEVDANITFGQKIADSVAAFGGSWRFIILFACIIFSWILINTLFLLKKAFDPYPFILLNLVLSCLAALQAPVIMMSQNRKGEKDRYQADHDYQVNLKAELEIRHLHEKIDFLTHQWVKLMETQEMQVEAMEELLETSQNEKPIDTSIEK
jgi:uncharacterized membrane protein